MKPPLRCLPGIVQDTNGLPMLWHGLPLFSQDTHVGGPLMHWMQFCNLSAISRN
jgi:hypothetical protein